MGIGANISIRDRVGGYEQAAIVGILLTVLGSTMGWLTVSVEPDAASELDDFEAGTSTMTGTDLGFGAITLYLAIIAAVVLALVLWRYRAAGRKTGLLVMLIGLIAAGVATVGIVVTGILFAPAGEIDGVSVDLAGGILVTLLGSLVMLSGGILRLAAGPPEVEGAESSE